MIKVALVVGHRSGAKGAWGNAGVSEWDYNKLLAADIAKEHIPNVAVKVFYRDNAPGGYGEKMKRLHQRLDAWGADYSVSMHFNAAGRSDINGHEVLYCSKAGRVVAKMMDEILAKNLPNKERGIKQRSRKERGGGFLCQGKSVCILVEPFFAAHQKHYMPGMNGYKALKKSYIELLKQLGEIGRLV